MYCVYVSDLTDIQTPLLNVEIEYCTRIRRMCDFLLIHTFGKCVQVPLSLFIYMKKLNNSQQLLFITNMISPVFVLAKIEKKMS